MILAKLGSPEQVGQFALGLAITAPVVLFANLGLRPYQATDANRLYSFGEYLGVRLISTIFALLVVVGILLLAGYERETALVIFLVGVAKSFEAVSDILYGLLQQRERMDRIGVSMVTKGLLSLAALGLAFYLTGSVAWGVAGLAAAWALVLLGYDLRSGLLVLGSRAALRPRWEPARLRTLALLSLPLGLAVVLTSLNANVPRYLIEQYLGVRELGIFVAMAYPLYAGNTVVGALGQSASPRLARYFSEGSLRGFRDLLLKLAGGGALLGVVGLLIVGVAGREILAILYTPEYAEHVSVFAWLVISAGLGYAASFLSFGMIAARYLKAQVPLFLSVIGATTISCLLLLPRVGLLGAGMAAAVGMAVQLVGSAGVLVHALRRGPQK